MSKILTVVGGTGTQGLSVINAALQDGTYKIRALTRNPSGSKAAALTQKGVEVVKADINDEQSLIHAFEVRYLTTLPREPKYMLTLMTVGFSCYLCNHRFLRAFHRSRA